MTVQIRKQSIAVAVERSTVYGRNILRGFAEIAGNRPEWNLTLLDPRGAAVAARRNLFDAWICRIPDDRAAAALARTGRPVVDLAAPHDRHRFASVATDAKAIGRLAAKHLLERRYPAFAFCGYPGIGFSDRRRDAFAAALAQNGFEPCEYRPPREFDGRFGVDYRLGDRLVETPDAAPCQSPSPSSAATTSAPRNSCASASRRDFPFRATLPCLAWTTTPSSASSPRRASPASTATAWR